MKSETETFNKEDNIPVIRTQDISPNEKLEELSEKRSMNRKNIILGLILLILIVVFGVVYFIFK